MLVLLLTFDTSLFVFVPVIAKFFDSEGFGSRGHPKSCFPGGLGKTHPTLNTQRLHLAMTG